MVSRAAGGSSRSLRPGGLCLWAGRDKWVSQLLSPKTSRWSKPSTSRGSSPLSPSPAPQQPVTAVRDVARGWD